MAERKNITEKIGIKKLWPESIENMLFSFLSNKYSQINILTLTPCLKSDRTDEQLADLYYFIRVQHDNDTIIALHYYGRLVF